MLSSWRVGGAGAGSGFGFGGRVSQNGERAFREVEVVAREAGPLGDGVAVGQVLGAGPVGAEVEVVGDLVAEHGGLAAVDDQPVPGRGHAAVDAVNVGGVPGGLHVPGDEAALRCADREELAQRGVHVGRDSLIPAGLDRTKIGSR